MQTTTNIIRLPTEWDQPQKVIIAAEEVKEDPKMITLLSTRIKELEAELKFSKI